MDIITLGDDLLRKKSDAIAAINGETAALAADLMAAMRIGKGIGLAAPQLGLLKQIFVIQVREGTPMVFINPTLIGTSPELTAYEEGCLSVPGIYADVNRSAAVSIQACNEKGRPFTLDADGLLARVILHEYDHLEGILFIDRLSEPTQKKILSLYEKKKRKYAQ